MRGRRRHGKRLLPGGATLSAAQVFTPPNLRSARGSIAWLEGK